MSYVQKIPAQDDDNTTELCVDAKCKENIFNAFLILNYRGDLQLQRIEKYNYFNNLIYTLGIMSYFTMIAQCAGLIVLMRLIMLSSGNSSESWGKESRDSGSYLLYPFLFFGVIATAKELRQLDVDINIFKEWKMHDSTLVYQLHLLFLKLIGEFVLGFVGGSAYFIILTMYSPLDTYEDMLNVILNLLAYQFVLDVDEWVYEWFASVRIAEYMKRDQIAVNDEEKVDDIFEGKYKIEKEPSFRDANWMFVQMFGMLLFATVFQSLLSHEVMLLIIFSTICVLTIIGIMIYNKFSH